MSDLYPSCVTFIRTFSKISKYFVICLLLLCFSHVSSRKMKRWLLVIGSKKYIVLLVLYIPFNSFVYLYLNHWFVLGKKKT